jgi:uncharacterized protein (DUF2267 family)
MEYKEFITHVQSVAQSNSREEAERATRATLETLTERIPREETNEIAAELPQELGQYLQGREGEPSESFNLQEFISRVSQREMPSSLRNLPSFMIIFLMITKNYLQQHQRVKFQQCNQ